MTIHAVGAVRFGAVFAVAGKPSAVDEVTDAIRAQADSDRLALRTHTLEKDGEKTVIFATGNADARAFDQSVGAYEAFQQMAAKLDSKENLYRDNGYVARHAKAQMDSLMHSFLTRNGTPAVENLFSTFARIVSEYNRNFHAHVQDLLPERVTQAYQDFLQRVPAPLAAPAVARELAQGTFDLQAG